MRSGGLTLPFLFCPSQESKTSRKDIFEKSQFHFLSLTVLREYLDLEFTRLIKGGFCVQFVFVLFSFFAC